MGKWSDELVNLTRKSAYPGAMMKSSGMEFGMMSVRNDDCVKIVGVEMKNYMPVPTGEVIAEFGGIEEMIENGWVID